MRFKVLISEGEDGWFVVECPSIPGCVTQGKTAEEALENIKDAIQGCLDVLSERTKAKGHEKVVEVVALSPSCP
ncbi:MAG TPA: type II toxin-antitoxin system HicB family antitoxin [Methanotrichaceae archaeon]|nr:type II toxin-antitoxin system HicB family antitoxin [Methanotrichaceae archaeon]